MQIYPKIKAETNEEFLLQLLKETFMKIVMKKEGSETLIMQAF